MAGFDLRGSPRDATTFKPIAPSTANPNAYVEGLAVVEDSSFVHVGNHRRTASRAS